MFKDIAIHRRHAATLLLLTAVIVSGGCNRSGGGGSGSNPPPDPGTLPNLALERAFSALSFSSPVAMGQAPGDDTRWFVVQRGGKVIVFPNDESATPTQTSEFVSITVNSAGEGGLLGMAFHPDFPATPEVFLSYTRTGPDGDHPLTTVISRFTSTDGGLTLNAATEEEILTLDQPDTNHNGGQIAFDLLGMLFIGLGDGGGGNDPGNHGQNTATLLGSMLRIDVDGTPAPGKNYAIPNDNPFVAGGGAPEIYAWGLRNPWRWSFDRGTNRLWVGDVGQGAWEEIDIIRLGGNYGWRICEGSYVRGSTTNKCANPAFIDPIAEYDHSQGCSVTGGYVYRGSVIADLFGDYLFGDFCSGTIWGLREVPGSAPIVEPVINSGLSVVAFGEGVDGEIFVVHLGGTLHRIIAAP